MSEIRKPLPAFIIGNGVSRRSFDPRRLLSHGLVIGCNALYRDFYPDILVALDPGMIKEIYESDFPQHRFIVPPEHEHGELSGSGRKNNAGMIAMVQAVRRGHKEIFCLGFDFLIEYSDAATGNVYDQTPNYGPETRATAEDNEHRTKYLTWFAQKFAPECTFTFVYPRAAMQLRSVGAPNVHAMFYDDFEKWCEGNCPGFPIRGVPCVKAIE